MSLALARITSAVQPELTIAPAPRRLGYRPALDGLRAVAVLSVMAFHILGWPAGGGLGVDMFFVLSGFLISTVLLEEWLTRGAISLGNFYARRALRLVPALLLLLLVYLAFNELAALAHRDTGTSPGLALSGVAFAATYLSDFRLAATAPFPPELAHLWSLGIEEQFYLLWPAALLIALKCRPGPRLAQVCLLAGIAAVALNRLAGVLAGADWNRLSFSPDTRFDGLLMGCLFATWFVWRPALVDRWCARFGAPSAAVCSVLALALIVHPGSPAHRFGALYVLFNFATAVLILYVVLSPGGWLAAVLDRPALVFTGKISYSLYLWHLPVFWMLGVALPSLPAAVKAPLAVALAFAAASGSHYWLERPILRFKARFTAVAPGAAVSVQAA